MRIVYGFDVAGAAPDVSISLSSTGDSDSSESIALSALSQDVNPDGFTTVTINFQDLPDGTVLTNDTWDRVTFQGGANGAVVCFYTLHSIAYSMC